jgi:phage terminase small subunit
MEGVKGKRGGARVGAGRKPKPPAVLGESGEKVADDPLEFLLGVMNDPGADAALRVRAAIAAAQYVHTKTHDGGKKEAREEAAKQAGAGKFSAAAPPKLVVNNG